MPAVLGCHRCSNFGGRFLITSILKWLAGLRNIKRGSFVNRDCYRVERSRRLSKESADSSSASSPASPEDLKNGGGPHNINRWEFAHPERYLIIYGLDLVLTVLLLLYNSV
jgi:hypothetical protein